MTTPEHAPHTHGDREALGSYLLGALDPHERAEVERHLADCRRCRDETASLAPLPGLLSRLTAEEAVEGPPPVDDAMLERLLTAATRERRTSAVRRRVVAVAAALALVGGTAGGVAIYRSVSEPTVHVVSAASGPLHMRVEMAPASNGTQLTLWLSGVSSGERCELIAVSDTGSREVAGSWQATYAGAAMVKGTTAIPYAHLRQLVVQTYDGRQLLATSV